MWHTPKCFHDFHGLTGTKEWLNLVGRSRPRWGTERNEMEPVMESLVYFKIMNELSML